MKEVVVFKFSEYAKRYNDLVTTHTKFTNPGEMMETMRQCKGDVFLITAKPQMGKSYLMLSMILDRIDVSVAIISLQDCATDLFERMLIMNGDKCLEFHNPRYASYLMKSINDNRQINILYKNGMSIKEIRAELKLLKISDHIEVVFLNYLQLIQGDNIITQLKLIAKELELSIVILSQLPGTTKYHDEYKPQLDHLGIDDTYLSSVDHILYLYRPFYYQITEDLNGNSTIDSALLHWLKGKYYGVAHQMSFDEHSGRFSQGDPVKTIFR